MQFRVTMKKFAALSFASFYLLLTTGMFVCLVSCGTSHLMKLVALNVSSESHCHKENETHCEEKSEEPCDGNKDCSCCKQHGTFTVKANIKPDSNFHVLEIPIIAENIACLISYIGYTFETSTDAWPEGNAPPGAVKEPLYISNRSLLI